MKIFQISLWLTPKGDGDDRIKHHFREHAKACMSLSLRSKHKIQKFANEWRKQAMRKQRGHMQHRPLDYNRGYSNGHIPLASNQTSSDYNHSVIKWQRLIRKQIC